MRQREFPFVSCDWSLSRPYLRTASSGRFFLLAGAGGPSGPSCARPVALFGSYDWGDGEWMRTWEQAAKDAGVNVVETYIAHLEPDDDALTACEALGAKLAG